MFDTHDNSQIYFEEEEVDEEEDVTFIICKIMYIFQIMEQKASSGK